jgi:hypothetical protein
MNYELRPQGGNQAETGLIGRLRLKDENGDIAGFNEDLVSRILAGGDPDELRDLQKFWSENGREVSDQDLELFSYYQKLRQQAHQDVQIDLAKRKSGRPEKTEEEIELGCYLEQLESQVRQVTRNLNSKGYKTQGSGFGPENLQKIYCAENRFQDLRLSEKFLAELQKRGIELIVRPKDITMRCHQKFSLEELREIWLEVESQIKARETLT